MTGIYILEWALGVIGATVLLDHSTYNSKIQPMIRKSMLYLIAESRWDRQIEVLSLIQEGIGCCGADGPHDYITWKKPLPSECRDSVTGNAYYYGCVDELSWYLEEKSTWLSGLVVIMSFIFILQAVFTMLLVNYHKKTK